MIGAIAFLLGTTLMYSTPLIFTAIGGTISEKSGVVNIGLEGMMIMGAFMGAAAGALLNNPWLGFLAAGLVGGTMALMHAFASITLKGDQVVSGIAMNFLGIGFSLFLCKLMFNGKTQTPPLNLDNKIPRPLNFLFQSDTGILGKNSFLGIVFNQYATVFLAFALVFIVWFVFYKTRFGLRIRAVGEHPEAADTLGINVILVRYISVILSGVFAGFGGAAMSIAIVSRFSPTVITGQGFIALAAMIFGNWKPRGAMLACLFFGFTTALGIYIGLQVKVIPSALLATLPYVSTLVILVVFGGKTHAPSASGKVFKKGGE